MPPIPLEIVAETTSTSEVLKRRAEAGEGEVALLARRQTAGQGRLGRRWETVDGNLHLSVLLRPGRPVAPGPWSLLAAVAVAGALAPLLPPGSLRLKWPNDVLLNGAKLAGILLDAGANPAPWLVIGIGINLAGSPNGLDRATASLADWTVPPPPETFAPTVLASLDAWRSRYAVEGMAPVRTAWLALGPEAGTPLTATVAGRPVQGRFVTLAPDGTLVLDTPEGRVTVSSGELG